MSSEPTVFIVDDDESVRTGLEILFKSMGIKFETYACGVEFLQHYDPLRPGCLIIDVRLPDISGLDLQQKLKMLDYVVPIIIITGYANVSMAVGAMENGAMIFLEKPLEEQVLLENVQKAFVKDAEARKEQARQTTLKKRMDALSEREQEVLHLVVAGKSNKKMAAELGISEKTVDFHRANIKEKTGLETVAELVQLVMTLKTERLRDTVFSQ